MRSNQSNSRRNRLFDVGVILLIRELMSLEFNTFPPVTLVTVIGQILLFIGFIEVPWDRYEVCISGSKVWERRDWKSLILSTFEHGDDMHLYYNMISFLVKGRTLEMKYGSQNFALLLAILSVMTPLMYVALAVAGSSALDQPNLMKSCAIGFSGVIFALKFILTVEDRGYTSLLGFRVPLKYSSWIELIAIHILVPNSSFMGHLAGILSGFIYMKTPVGRLIDAFISSLTGRRVAHESYGFRYDTWDSSYNGANSESNFRGRSNYERFDGYGFRNEYQYGPRNEYQHGPRW